MTMGNHSVRGQNLSFKTHNHALPGHPSKGYGVGVGMVLGPGDLPVQPLSRERVRGKFTVGRGRDGNPLPSHAQGLGGAGPVDYTASSLLDPLAVFPFDQGGGRAANRHDYDGYDIITHPDDNFNTIC